MSERRDQNILQTVQEYGQRLFAFIRGRVATEADAEDILQDVWYQLSRAGDVDSIEQMGAWLYRVARNNLIDRSRKKRPVLIDDYAGESEDAMLFPSAVMADLNTPEMETVREFFWEELTAALDELPTEQRDVFVRNELDGETFQQISDETGVNLKTLISRKRYAVRFLRTRLQDFYDDFYS